MSPRGHAHKDGNPGRTSPDARDTDARDTTLPALSALLLNRSALILFLLALLYRIVYLLEFRETPFWCLLYGDPELYHQRAEEILRGDVLGKWVSFHSSPLYPYFLALIYRVVGVSIPAVFVVQSILGSLDVALVAAMGRLLLGRTGFWLTGIPLAFWPLLAYFSAEQLEITLVLLGVHVLLLLLLRDRQAETSRGLLWTHRPKTLFPAGLALGLAVLGKPNSALFLPVWFLAEWIRARKQRAGAFESGPKPQGSARGSPRSATSTPVRFAWGRTAPLLAGVVLCVAPFTMRNLTVNHDLVLTSANGGINLYIGNNPAAGGIFRVPAVLQGDLYESSRRVAENALGRTLKASEVSGYWTHEALAWITHSPGAWLRLTGRKLLLLFNGLEISNHFDPNFLAREIPVMRISPFRYGLWIPFAFWGIVLAAVRARRPRAAAPADRLLAVPLLWLLAYCVSLLPFFMTARYRMPVVPTLVLFSAYGILDLAERVRARRFTRTLGVAAGLVAAGFTVAWLPLLSAEGFFFNQYQILGAEARDRGEMEEAVRQYSQALALEPRSVIGHNSIATCLARLGRNGEAAAHLEQALRLDPDYPPAWRNLAGVRRTQGRPEEERAALRRALELDPRFRVARQDLVRALLEAKDYETALARLEEGLRFDPSDDQALWNRALLLGQVLGRKAEALATLDRLDALKGRNPKTEALRGQLSGP